MKKFFLLFLFIVSTISVSAKDMRFVQVDSVMFSTYDMASATRLENLVTDINKQKNVDFVVFSGNNISRPSKENLLGFIKITKKLNVPYYFILGNKDVNKQKHFGKNEYITLLSRKVRTHKKIQSPNYVFEKNKYVFIVADGSKDVIPTSSGYFRENVLTWLDEQLKLNSNKKVIILQHFPVVPPAEKEARYTHKVEKYQEVLSKHNNVKAIISGNFGVNKEEMIDGVLHISTADAPMYRIIDILDYETENPIFWSTIKQ